MQHNVQTEVMGVHDFIAIKKYRIRRSNHGSPPLADDGDRLYASMEISVYQLGYELVA